MRVTQVDQAWVPTPAGRGELVCILDTGIDPTHGDLIRKVDRSRSRTMISRPLFPGDTTILDYNFHGSHVAGIVSSNGRGVASVAPDARRCAVKVLRFDGFGSFGDLVAGIVYATDVGADVLNM